jgi:hypothetical protein
MGVAVNGMHFTGMFAMSVAPDTVAQSPSGFLPILFVAPIALFVIIVVVVLLTALINRSGSPDDPDDGSGGSLTRRLLPQMPTSPGVGPASATQGSRIAGAFGARPNR